MTAEQSFTIWIVRASALLYAAALCLMIIRADAKRARLVWSAGLCFFLIHVAAAFAFFHGWSHAAAYEHTARQTQQLFGVSSGSGLWLNYLFTLVWILDAAWWWADPRSYAHRPRGLTAAIHGFMVFLFFNATVVFGAPTTRWVAALVASGVVALWFRSRRAIS